MDRVKQLLERGWARAKGIPWTPATVVLAILAIGILGLALQLLAELARVVFYVAAAVGIGFVIWRFACAKKAEALDPEDEPEGSSWWEVFGS